MSLQSSSAAMVSEQKRKKLGKSPCPGVCIGRLVWCLEKSELSLEYVQAVADSDSGQKSVVCGDS